ncbi:MAG: cadherin repeat domain-containing protein, partial [Ekhidna sp.]|nr:cadherin repeat domain-containing protein [Ekhidna sp.]
PVAADQTLSVSEDAAVGTAVGTVTVADAEKDDLSFGFLLAGQGGPIRVGDSTNLFALNTSTGAIATVEILDHERRDTHYLTVVISNGQLSNTVAVEIKVTDADVPGEHVPDSDIETLEAAGNTSPTGIWSDGTTMWVANNSFSNSDNKIYAYVLATGARDDTKEVFDLVATGNTSPTSIWSDGTTIWVADSDDNKIYAYVLATGVRDESKEVFDFAAAGNTSSTGIWSDETTMWVADSNDDKIYAYVLATGARDDTKDIETLDAAGNTSPTGIWSDGTTMWVANSNFEDSKLYAYTLATGARVANKDINGLRNADHYYPGDIWSNGTTYWVRGGDKIYAYRSPK